MQLAAVSLMHHDQIGGGRERHHKDRVEKGNFQNNRLKPARFFPKYC